MDQSQITVGGVKMPKHHNRYGVEEMEPYAMFKVH